MPGEQSTRFPEGSQPWVPQFLHAHRVPAPTAPSRGVVLTPHCHFSPRSPAPSFRCAVMGLSPHAVSAPPVVPRDWHPVAEGIIAEIHQGPQNEELIFSKLQALGLEKEWEWRR